MGIVAFKWEDGQLTLLQNREECDIWKTKPAIWDEGETILRNQPDDNLGTWFGISKTGKVAFLVDSSVSNELSLPDLRPVDFLRGEMSPSDYANKLSQDSAAGESISKGLMYNIIVADINSSSMFHIFKKNANLKKVDMEEVGFGVHTLTSQLGLDDQFSKSSRMKDLLNVMIGAYRDKQKLPLELMAKMFIYDPPKPDRPFLIPGEKEFFKTMSTTALEVKHTKEVMFYEGYLVENGDWKDNNFTFNIE